MLRSFFLQGPRAAFFVASMVVGASTACGPLVDSPSTSPSPLEESPPAGQAPSADGHAPTTDGGQADVSSNDAPAAACSAPEKVALVAGRSAVTIAVSGETLYFVDRLSGIRYHDEDFRLWKVGFDGAPPTAIANGFTSYPKLTADGSGVYVLDDSSVYKVDGAGGPKTLLANLGTLAGFYNGAGITSDDNDVFVTGGMASTNDNAGYVVRIPKTGGAPVVLVDNEAVPARVAVDDGHVYWHNNYSSPSMQAPGDAPLSLRRIPKTGGTPTTLAQGNTFLLGVGTMGGTSAGTFTLGNDYLYVASAADGAIFRYPKAGGVAETVALDASTTWPQDIVTSGGHAIWTNGQKDYYGSAPTSIGIFRAPVAGGAVERLTALAATELVVSPSGTLAFIVQSGMFGDGTLHFMPPCATSN